MSKISLDLSSIKSAGVYTLEIDESQRTEAQVNALRLLVGFSGKGPFNRPVFLQNEGQRQKMFGDVDAKLEKKGCYFNRSAKTMLDAGSILALNLLKVDDSFEGPDQVNYVAFSLDAGKKNPVVADPGITYGEVDYLAETVDADVYGTTTGSTIPFVGKAPYAAMFDRSRFWTPSETNLMNVATVGLGININTGSLEKSNFMNFANTGTDEISILVYKPEGFTGYDITAKDWYGGEENIPYAWIRPSDFISDYFIRVVAVKGNWSNYPILSADKNWSKYFNSKGVLKDKIMQFCQADGISMLGSWTGVIIPDFTDKQGNYLYIKDRVNAQTEATGLLMAINEDAMEVIAYDKNGMDKETGEVGGTGTWIYDYDGNAEGDSDAGETAIAENGYLIDMVGHGFQNGVKKATELKQLVNAYASDIFDGSVGTLNNSVYYLDVAGDLTGLTNETTIKVPYFKKAADTNIAKGAAEGAEIYLYKVCAYNASTGKNDSLDSVIDGKTDYQYIPLDNARYLDSSVVKVADVKKMVACDENCKLNNASIGNDINSKDTSVVVVKTDIRYSVDTSIRYGNYASFSTANDSSAVYIFSVQSGADGAEVISEKILDVETLDSSTWNSLSVKTFSYNGIQYGVNPTNAEIWSNEETGTPSMYGVNFLSYDYVSNTRDEVLTNVRNVYYFNNKKNSATDSEAVNITDASLYVEKETPVSADCLNMFIITNEREADKISVGDYVENITFRNIAGESTKFGLIPGVTRVTKKIFVNVDASNKFTYNGKVFTYQISNGIVITKTGKRGFYLFTTVDPVLIYSSNRVVRQLSIHSDVISKQLRFIPLKGLHISSRHRPGYDRFGRIGVDAGIEKIYSVLTEEGISRGLCNPNLADYRYIVDSMSFGINQSMGGKKYLSMLATDRGKTTALLNMPSKKQFEVSSDPVFCETYDANTYVKPSFSAKFIPMGGNMDMYSTKSFSLPTEEEGSKFAAAFFPHLIYNDGGRRILVPPAADVSNTFMRKFQGNDPYAVVANQNGVIRNGNVVGVEYECDQNDRDYLEPFGVNCIINDRNSGVMIYGNQTCFQNYKSDFNKLHIRENLNTLEIACESVLKTFNFKYNTPQVRAQVVTALTPIFESMKLSQALVSYELVCDETNNTAEVISNDTMICEASIYCSHSMEKIIQKFTLHKLSDLDA